MPTSFKKINFNGDFIYTFKKNSKQDTKANIVKNANTIFVDNLLHEKLKDSSSVTLGLGIDLPTIEQRFFSKKKSYNNKGYLHQKQKLGKLNNNLKLLKKLLSYPKIFCTQTKKLFLKYNLETYRRSNQDTCLIQKPAVKEGDWIETGDLLADSASSMGGELAIGHNIIVAYMPWEGYNYEDAILINERLVYEDIYTSVHIERYEVLTTDTKLGSEQITREIPDINENEISHLDKNGIAKIGSWVEEGDILVGKITPFNIKTLTPQQKLLYKIFNKQLSTTKDSSLRAPKGIKANVINVNILKKQKIELKNKDQKKRVTTKKAKTNLLSQQTNSVPSDKNKNNNNLTTRNPEHENANRYAPSYVHIYLAEKRKIQVGDKMAGRHGNKGIISLILPRQDMPFLPDGTSVDIVLNPLGVPSRMNVGQIYECLLGLAGRYLGEHYKIPPFDEMYGADASRSFVLSKLYDARKKTGLKWLFDPNHPGKIRLFDGRNSECFDQTVTVGIAYVLKLVHMVDDKLHCLTSDHDVLTTEGWRPINEISVHDNVATLNRHTGELVYQKPTEIFHYVNYKGSLYHIKNSNLDLLTTLNHRMLVRKGCITGESCSNYELIQVKEIIGKHYRYLKKANWNKNPYQFVLPSVNSDSSILPQKQVNMSAWLTFFGLWIAEGWTTSNKNVSQNNSVYQIQFALDKEPVTTVLKNALQTLGYNFKIFDNKLTINNKQLWSYLQPLSLQASNKSLPAWVWELNQQQAQNLLYSMCLGDGTCTKTSMSYYTTSIKLTDDVMRLALHAGWSANKYLHLPKGSESVIEGCKVVSNYAVWRLALIQSKNNPAVNHGHHIEQNAHQEEILPYEGSVYCLSVPHEVFYVRRNGLPVWTGNSRSTGPYSLVTQQPLRGRSKQGGQRLGEMEVWAIEGFGAAFVLSEMLTIKSDDMTGRQNLWKNLIENNDISLGSPESFKVLVCELQALCLDIGLFRKNMTKKDLDTKNRADKPKSTSNLGTSAVIEIDNLLHLA
uniref:DNA-directed RNA polymerase n=1 Tax=Pleodorina starrii TaxID=330485 RepID=M9P865_9CHLO|nr:beta subunit of RNA polymerase [Pleodorina starrii]AFY64460.1 beta subunit of RNA polymerase [Pleodorina starrii]